MKKLKHIIIEAFCYGNKIKNCPFKNSSVMGSECFRCQNFNFAIAPNELAFSNEYGIVETSNDFIGFGGDMIQQCEYCEEALKEIWKRICRKKNRRGI